MTTQACVPPPRSTRPPQPDGVRHHHRQHQHKAQHQRKRCAELVCLTTDAILLGFAGRYFKTEQAEGTPFTESGADLIKKLGIRCIWMPIVAVVIASVITVCLGVESSSDISNLPSVVTGIVLILASLIFRYGAELEKQNRAVISGREKRDTLESRNTEER